MQQDAGMKKIYKTESLFIILTLCALSTIQAYTRDMSIHWQLYPVGQADLPDLSVTTLQSDAIFEPHSAHFKPMAASYMIKALNMIKRADPTLLIYINVYSDDIPNAIDRRLLTDAQAQSVGSYLWSQGIAYDRMTMRGLGSQRMIGNIHSVVTNALNRRVEVVLVPASAPQQIYPFKE